MTADQAAAVLWHHAAVFLVVLAAPIEMVDVELEIALALGQRVQHFDPGGHHFRADSVAGNGGYSVRLHQSLRRGDAARLSALISISCTRSHGSQTSLLAFAFIYGTDLGRTDD